MLSCFFAVGYFYSRTHRSSAFWGDAAWLSVACSCLWGAWALCSRHVVSIQSDTHCCQSQSKVLQPRCYNLCFNSTTDPEWRSFSSCLETTMIFHHQVKIYCQQYIFNWVSVKGYPNCVAPWIHWIELTSLLLLKLNLKDILKSSEKKKKK